MEDSLETEARPRGRPRKQPLAAINEPSNLSEASHIEHSEPCAFVVNRKHVKSASGDVITEDHVCGNPAKVRGILKFSGTRREQTLLHGSKVYRDHVYKWHMDCGPVCETHREIVRKDFSSLLPNSRFSAEIKSFSDQGFPVPDEKLTRLMWQPVEAPPVANEYRTQIPEMQSMEDEDAA